MRNVSASHARYVGRNSVLFLLLALTAALIWPAFGSSARLLADEADAAASPAAPAADASAPAAEGGAATPVQSRSFLAYIVRACGWFWGPAFLLVSFILVALIMMNLLQVRRDVLLPTQFVEGSGRDRGKY